MFKKGQKIYMFNSWDDQGTIAVSEMTVVSWGKVRGTLKYTETGNMLESDVRMSLIEATKDTFHSTKYIAVDDCPYPERYALEMAKGFLDEEIIRYKNRIENNQDSPGFVKAIQECIDELHEPRVKFYSR